MKERTKTWGDEGALPNPRTKLITFRAVVEFASFFALAPAAAVRGGSKKHSTQHGNRARRYALRSPTRTGVGVLPHGARVVSVV